MPTSDAKVSSQLDIKTIVPPGDEPDAWEAFRQIEIVRLEFTQQYKHSLGKASRFFIELENQRFMGTQCPDCEKVFTPPRPLCPDCLSVTSWLELSGNGTLETFSVMYFSNGVNSDVQDLALPLVFAYVLPDGSSTLFPHILKCDPEKAYSGMPVRIAYTQQTVSHPIHLMYFTPAEDDNA